MNEEDDVFKLISDFIKGKSGPPDMSAAQLSVTGKLNTDEITMPQLSRDYGDFAAEYPVVTRAMKHCSLSSCLACFGAMLTLPEFQSNNRRLEILIHLALMFARGRVALTPGKASAWFNQLDEGTCGRVEDPAEDVFVAPVTLSSESFLVFEGTAEGNAFQTQVFLNALDDMPDRGAYLALKNSVRALLRVSQTMAERVGVDEFLVGNTVPASKIGKPGAEVWSQLMKNVTFSFDELDEIGVTRQELQPFIIHEDTFELLDKLQPGHTPVEAHPVYETKKGLIFFAPSVIGLAIRHFIIEQCIEADMQEVLHASIANAYTRLFSSEPFLGDTRLTPQLAKHAGLYVSHATKEIDSGRYLHVVFVVDSFDGYEDGTFAGHNDFDKTADFVRRAIEEAHSKVSERAGYREAITLVIGCGWGRGFGFGLHELPANWRIEMIPAFDAFTLSRLPSFSPLEIFRVLDAKRCAEAMGIEILNANGLLNLYAWMKENHGHIIPHEKLQDDFLVTPGGSFLHLPINSNLNLRQRANLGAHIKTLRRPDGTLSRFRRNSGTPRYGTDELSPFYVDLEGIGGNLWRSVYLGKKGAYWIEGRVPQGTDASLSYHMLAMVMHWSEQVFRHLDEAVITENLNVCLEALFDDHEMPIESTTIPDEKEISSLVSAQPIEIAGYTAARIQLHEGYLLSAQRHDNLGERIVVRAMVSSILGQLQGALGDAQTEDIVSAVMPSEHARHFHGFTVPNVRDFVRDDLPNSVVKITSLDDAQSRLGLGWKCRDPSQGLYINGLEDCKTYLRQLVLAVVNELKGSLSGFNRFETIYALLLNHEAAMKEFETWRRTFASVNALSTVEGGATAEASESIAKLNAASMASRLVVEAAVSECPLEAGLAPGRYDLAQLMSRAALLHHLGGYSVAMEAGMMPAEIKISPAGDVMMNHSFSDNIITPFGQSFQSQALRDAADAYVENYAQPGASADDHSKSDKSELDEMFEQAWFDEYGSSIDEIAAIIGGFEAIAHTDRKAVIPMLLSELITRLATDTGLEEERLRVCVEPFLFTPRASWNDVPKGFEESSWHPWRFQRQLSIVSRPIIQLDTDEDPTCLIAPAMTYMHILKFVSDARLGDFDQKFFRAGGSMFKWMGRINGSEGEEFNKSVASEFHRCGWEAKANLSDGQIFSRPKKQGFGDVDVLAWNQDQRRVLIVECKDLSFAKTMGEIAWQLSKYKGEIKPNGQPDLLRKHLNRCEEIEENRQALSMFVGFEVSTIDRILLMSQATPLQFAKFGEENSVAVVTFREIEPTFGGERNG